MRLGRNNVVTNHLNNKVMKVVKNVNIGISGVSVDLSPMELLMLNEVKSQLEFSIEEAEQDKNTETFNRNAVETIGRNKQRSAEFLQNVEDLCRFIGKLHPDVLTNSAELRDELFGTPQPQKVGKIDLQDA